MSHLTADEFNALCDSLRDAHSSLRGCPRDRRQNEAEIMSKVRDQLVAAKLKVDDTRLIRRRINLVRHADETLHKMYIAESEALSTGSRVRVCGQQMAATRETLAEVRAEISRLNAAAGETVFNPAITQMVDAAIKEMA